MIGFLLQPAKKTAPETKPPQSHHRPHGGKIFSVDFFFHLLDSCAIKPGEQTTRRLTFDNNPFGTPPKHLPKKR